MLKYIASKETGCIAMIDVDVVRINDQRMCAILTACNSPEGEELGAFVATYDNSVTIQLMRGDSVEHKAFVESLSAEL